MPVSVVVGGQFGSEGKGKIALEVVRRTRAAAVVRVGGTNSGHTVVDHHGRTRVLRQLPGAVADGRAMAVLPPGSYIEPEILLKEIQLLQLGDRQVAVDPYARIILDAHKKWEEAAGLGRNIGSTQSGTGAAVLAATARQAENLDLPTRFAKDIGELAHLIQDTSVAMRRLMDEGSWLVIEGTQGFGLSLLHGRSWPKATSRDTTASGFVAEAGLSPLDVADVTLVIRSFPIRVAGNSGPLTTETTWDQIAADAGISSDLTEFTTVTKRKRRVGRFDPEVVRRAILVNQPTRIALNHLDYIDPSVGTVAGSAIANQFVGMVEEKIGRSVDWVGVGPATTMERSQFRG